jgi:hypothetical protein
MWAGQITRAVAYPNSSFLGFGHMPGLDGIFVLRPTMLLPIKPTLLCEDRLKVGLKGCG